MRQAPASFLEVPSAGRYDLPPLPFPVENEGGTVVISDLGKVITLPPFYFYTTDLIFPVGFKRFGDNSNSDFTVQECFGA
jgi:hypothetical protein